MQGLQTQRKQVMKRARFFVSKKACKNDYRPIKWPIKYPYWCTRENSGRFILIAYVDSIDELEELWPEAEQIETTEETEIFFSSRFPKPDWYEPK